MPTSIVYLFADTNLFIQCRPLAELDWSMWNQFSEIRIVVSQPVLREIDAQKGRGNDRLGRRARAASGILRKLIISNDEFQLIQTGPPQVKLFIKPELRPNPELRDSLDYSERDDQLIGIVHSFAQGLDASDTSRSARLLSHDGAPLALARSVDLKADPIPDDWLLPLERSEKDKQIAALKAENARLRASEPAIKISFLNHDLVPANRFEANYVWYEPLTGAEIGSLMQRLTDSFPIATDFGPSEPKVRPAEILGKVSANLEEHFSPAPEEDIAQYTDELYPMWLEKCESILENFSKLIQRNLRLPHFYFLAENYGTRPAKDALVTITAKGQLEISVPPTSDNSETENTAGATTDKNEAIIELPYPPPIPEGNWGKPVFAGLGQAPHRFTNLERSFRRLHRIIPTGYISTESSENPFRIPNILNTRHDSNRFYYKRDHPDVPTDSFSLECDQWRHGSKTEIFDGAFHFDRTLDLVKGSIECLVQADNLSEGALMRIPVKISVSRASAFERARTVVDELISKALSARFYSRGTDRDGA